MIQYKHRQVLPFGLASRYLRSFLADFVMYQLLHKSVGMQGFHFASCKSKFVVFFGCFPLLFS